MTLAVYALNNYLWKLLQEKADMDTSDYGGKIPIMPAAEAVEFDEFDKPFVVYGWAVEGNSDLYVLNTENVGYSIYSNSTTSIDGLINLINDAFRSKDEAAANVNRWINSSGNPLKSNFADINFVSVEAPSVSGPTPPVSEGGKSNGLIILRYQYTITVNAADYTFV